MPTYFLHEQGKLCELCLLRVAIWVLNLDKCISFTCTWLCRKVCSELCIALCTGLLFFSNSDHWHCVHVCTWLFAGPQQFGNDFISATYSDQGITEVIDWWVSSLSFYTPCSFSLQPNFYCCFDSWKVLHDDTHMFVWCKPVFWVVILLIIAFKYVAVFCRYAYSPQLLRRDRNQQTSGVRGSELDGLYTVSFFLPCNSSDFEDTPLAGSMFLGIALGDMPANFTTQQALSGSWRATGLSIDCGVPGKLKRNCTSKKKDTAQVWHISDFLALACHFIRWFSDQVLSWHNCCKISVIIL